MGLFSRRDKKKKGFFGRKNRVEEPEEASILQQPDAAESEPEAQQEEDIAGEAIAQQEAEAAAFSDIAGTSNKDADTFEKLESDAKVDAELQRLLAEMAQPNTDAAQ